MLGDIGAVAQPVAHQDVHDAKCQGRVGADAHRNVPIGARGRLAAPRIDDHQLDAALAHFLDLGPEVHVGGDEVGTPREDEVGMRDRLGIGAADRPHGDIPRHLAAGVAHGAGLQPTRAEGVEETVHQAAVQLALMRAIGIAEECERPALGDDGLPACSDLVERCVPRNRGELAFAFRPAPAQGGGEALRRMDKLGVTVDLGAGKPRREGLRGIAHHTHHAPALDLCEQRAHVGTIVRAHHPDRFHALPPKLPGERGRHCRGRR